MWTPGCNIVQMRWFHPDMHSEWVTCGDFNNDCSVFSHRSYTWPDRWILGWSTSTSALCSTAWQTRRCCRCLLLPFSRDGSFSLQMNWGKWTDTANYFSVWYLSGQMDLVQDVSFFSPFGVFLGSSHREENSLEGIVAMICRIKL